MPTRKAAKRRVSTLRVRAESTVQRLEAELPPNLGQYVRRMRKDLARLEKQLVSAQEGARKRWAHLLREASHQLGRVEALGEREWRKRTTRVRRDAVKLLRRLEKAIEPRSVAAPSRKRAKRAVEQAVTRPVARAAAAVQAAVPPLKAPATRTPPTGAPPTSTPGIV
jgi:hypothetical protein